MIKQLFLTAALLLPGLAYAGNPSADLSTQIVPAAPPPTPPPPGGNIACDQGPNASAIPAPAQRAGFTHCALNADFTIVGGPFSDPSTFVNPCGASNSLWPNGSNFYWENFLDASKHPPCSRVSIITDPVFGGQTLHLQYQPVDFNSGGSSRNDWNELNWPVGYSMIAGRVLPIEMYVEITFRTTVTSLNQHDGSIELFGPWNNPMNTPQSGGRVSEMDFDEIIDGGQTYGGPPWQNAYASVLGNRNCAYALNGGCDLTQNLLDWTSYHELGDLVTSDGIANLANCAYIDGIMQLCHTLNVSDSQYLDYPANTVSFNLGGNGPGNPFPNGGCPTMGTCIINNVDGYIQSIHVWMCDNYKTQTCPGTVVSGP